METTEGHGSMESTGGLGTTEDHGSIETTEGHGSMETTGGHGSMETTGGHGSMESTAGHGSMETTGGDGSTPVLMTGDGSTTPSSGSTDDVCYECIEILGDDMYTGKYTKMGILLSHTDHDSLVAGTANNGG